MKHSDDAVYDAAIEQAMIPGASVGIDADAIMRDWLAWSPEMHSVGPRVARQVVFDLYRRMCNYRDIVDGMRLVLTTAGMTEPKTWFPKEQP